MVKKGKKVWRTVQIPENIVEEIKKYLETKDAKKLGIDSISDFVVYQVRKKLEK